MLHHPTLDKLQQLKLTGMRRALLDQETIPEITAIPFEERLGLLVDRELTERDNRRMQMRLRSAKLKQNTALEDIDFKSPRGRDSRADSEAGRLRLGGGAPECADHRPHRRGQDLAGLRQGRTKLAVKAIARSMPESRACCRNWTWGARTAAMQK